LFVVLSSACVVQAASQEPQPKPPESSATNPLDTAEAAFALYDRAAAELRANRYAEAAALLDDGARRFPPPYRYDAEYLSEIIREESTAPSPDRGRYPLEKHHRRLACAFATLGDHRSAADQLWTLSEIDPVRFADDEFDMQMLNNCLVSSECSVDELRRVVRLAAAVPEPKYREEEYIWLGGDSKQIAKLKAADAAGRVAFLLPSCWRIASPTPADRSANTLSCATCSRLGAGKPPNRPVTTPLRRRIATRRSGSLR
jgi:hypothetical protein